MTRTLGIPGTGIYHRQTVGGGRRSGESQADATHGTTPPSVASTPPTPTSPSALDRAVQAVAAGDLTQAEEFAAAAMVQPENSASSELIEVQLTPGVIVELPPGRDAAALLLGEIRQARGDVVGALGAVAEASPTTHAAVAACELLLQDSRPQDVVDLTDSLEPVDDAACVALIFRGVAFRELGQLDRSGQVLDAALTATSSDAILAHAHFERALTFREAGLEERAQEEFRRIPPGHPLGPAASAQLAGANELRLSDLLPKIGAEEVPVDDLPPLELPER